jgi:hypothetical protein
MGEWFSYQEAGERLGISAEAVRQRAMRGHWPRSKSNEGVALVQIPEGVVVRRRTPVEQVDEHPPAPVREHPGEHPLERLIAALERHIGDLQADLTTVRAELADERKAVAELRVGYQRLVDELLELRKAAPGPAPTPAPRRSAPRPRPAPEAPATIDKAEFDTADGMAKILARLQARRAASGH